MSEPHLCVVFDLDDTLYLERDYVQSGFRHVSEVIAKQLGVNGFEDVAWRLFLAGVRGTIFNQALLELGLPADAKQIDMLVQAYRNHTPRISLAPDTLPCLETLRQQCKLGMVTDGPREMQERKISALQLHSKIPLRILTGYWEPQFAKPHPKAFISIQEETKTAPKHCFYIADNPAKDFSAPMSLGWKTVRVRRELGLHSLAKSPIPAPDFEFCDLTSVANIL